MDLQKYFESTKGIGILSTADKDGKVDSAVYAKPHIFEDGTFAFVMPDRLTHHNLQSNPHAAYLFVETGSITEGHRFFLKKVSDEKNPERLKTIRCSYLCNEQKEADGKDRFLVTFRVEKQLPLIGS